MAWSCVNRYVIASTDEFVYSVEGLVAETKVLQTGLATEVSRLTRATYENCKTITDIALRALNKKLPLLKWAFTPHVD